MNSRRRRKKDSPVKSVFLILIAAIVMVTAIYIVVNVVGKIKDDYETLEFSKEQDTTAIDIETEKEEILGWNETDQGWKYRLKKDEFAVSQWLAVEGFLYYFGDDSYMVTGELKQKGQIFTFHQTKGYLQDIQKDWNYLPESIGENLESLVKTNAFWCYLEEPEEGSSGPFHKILYRKTVENKIKPLGNASNPEKTTKNSMAAYGDYLYYLPKVKDSEMHLLSQDEQQLCNNLFRMIPGSDSKELVADNVDGYIVLDNIIYYAQGGKIYTAVSGIEYTTGDGRYSVVIQDGICYLVDEDMVPAVPLEGNTITIGDRQYQVDNVGKIVSVTQAEISANGRTYYLEGSGNNASVRYRTQEGETSLIKEPYGVQSYCMVGKEIYYSAYVNKDEDGQWYSRIFRTNMEGENKEEVSEKYPGSVEVMYYYEDEGEIYGEYYPGLWKQAYGQAVVITTGGSIFKIEDDAVRTGKSVDGNDRLQLVMVKDGKIAANWQDCAWSQNTGITGTYWSQGIELDSSKRILIETGENQEEETSAISQEGEEDVIIQPIESGASSESIEMVAPVKPPVISDPVISTDGPNKGTQAVPKESEDVVEIIPLG